MATQTKQIVTPDTKESYETRPQKRKVIGNELRGAKEFPKFPDLSNMDGSSCNRGIKLRQKPCPITEEES